MSLQLPAVFRLENALKTSVFYWSNEVTRIVTEYGVKELQSVLPLITDTLFELRVPLTWSLRCVTKASHPQEFDAIRNLLSPRGPVFHLCYKLLTDSTIRYELPLYYLPVATRHMLEEGVIHPFYIGKLHYHSQVRAPSSLILNSFEYFVMHFLYYLVNPSLQHYSATSAGSEAVYFSILEEYLNYFLPYTGNEPDLVPLPSQTSPFGSPMFSPSPKPRHETPIRQSTPSLLKKTTLTPTSVPGTSALSTERSSHTDSWRTLFLLQAFNELWLSHVTPNESSSIHSGSPQSRSLMSGLQPPGFLPSVDHLRAVRNLTKHLHYFANSLGPNTITGMDELKRTVWTYFQKKLYVFLRYTLEHWPLDGSFRLFLETWLSYIQPWRYTLQRTSSDGEKIVDWKWQNFVAENLLFYTLFLQKVILRLLRIELTSPKASLMLFRISKVYSQRNLKEMIAIAERSPGDGLASPKSGINSHLAVCVRQFINELENPSYSFTPLFGQETTMQIRLVLLAAARAKARLRQSLQPEPKKESSNIWSKVGDWFSSSGLESGDENSEELNKSLNHLEQASAQLSFLFDVEIPAELENESLYQTRDDQAMIYRTPSRGTHESLSGSTFAGSPVGPQRRYDLEYRGNPDIQPIRSFEVAFLVRLFHQVCTNINDKFAADLEESYNRLDFAGKVFRQVLSPPIVYQEVVKTFGSPKTTQKRLGPRLCLRKLAHKQLLGYVLGLFIIAYLLGWAPEIFALLLICVFWAIVFVRASIETWKERGRILLDYEESYT